MAQPPLKRHRRIYLSVKQKRTSLSIHYDLYRLLAAKLECDPESDDGYRCIAEWIQNEVEEGWSGGISWQIESRIIYAIADPKIVKGTFGKKKAEP